MSAGPAGKLASIMHNHVCGCYYFHSGSQQRQYLPPVKLDAHTTILSTAARTVLKQKFINASKEELEEIRYAFPLFDGVSVVDFVCKVGDRTIYGLVKEKSEARKTYQEAKERGEKAALLEQLPDAADVFTTSISNIPKNSSVEVSITYIQELKHDAEVDGVRLTIPTSISPRYGSYPGKLLEQSVVDDAEGISLTIDVSMTEGTPIKKVLSPSHPIEVSLGALSTSKIDDNPSISKASATLALGTAQLEQNFVLQVVVKDVGIPQAILETHPWLPEQRALMTTLVPKFNLKSQKPEIIFVVDRSGSMSGNIPTLISALKVFLKSIPIGCMFNICSFGSNHSFLWPTSQLYSQDTLAEAIKHVDSFSANFGGTETLNAVKACFDACLKDTPTEIMLLTDGDIWSQQQMFDYVSEQTKSGDVRVFPIGIGGGVSSALIEGIARAGRGFAQMVANNEKLDSKIVRMLKGALTPHVNDYRLEVKYEDESVESVAANLRVHLQLGDEESNQGAAPAVEADAKPISLFDPEIKEEHPKSNEPQDIFAGLPKVNQPKILQAPHEIPALFPFHRTCVYLLFSPAAASLRPKSVVLKATSPQGPLELEIPIEVRATPDQMIHQLAARKASQELEEGRGWILGMVTDGDNPGETTLVNKKYPAKAALLRQREAVRLGVEYQVGGKYCSFVAIEANEAEIIRKRQQAISAAAYKASGEGISDWETIDELTITTEGDGPEYGLKMIGMQNMLPDYKRARRNRTGQPPRRTLGGEPPRMMRLAHAPSSSSAKNTSNFDAEFQGGPLLSSTMAFPTISEEVQQQFAGWSYNRPGSSHAAGSTSPPKRKKINPPVSKEKVKKKKSSDVFTGPTGAVCHKEVDDLEYEICDEEIDFSGFDIDDDVGNSGAPARFLMSTTSSNASSRGQAAGSGSLGQDSGRGVARFLSLHAETDSYSEKEETAADEGTLLEDIIAHQSFEGSWGSFSISMRKWMDVKWEDAQNAVDGLVASPTQALDHGKADIVLNTAIVILYLEKKMADAEDTWELIVEKAKAWLEDNVEESTLKVVWRAAEGVIPT